MWLIPILALLVFLIAFLQSNKFKGMYGEYGVNKILKKIALKTGGLEMHDFMVEDSRSSSQIDHMLLTQKALYVIETKNYKGMIFGSLTQQNWTMTVKHVNKKKSKSGKVYKRTNISKHSFYNPVKQNQTHINKLNALTDISKTIPVYNIVVFCKRATLNAQIASDNTYVINSKELLSTIDSIESSLDSTLTLNQHIDFVDTLFDINITDKKARKAHVKNIKLQHNKK
jgi:hypothetical protein